VWLAGGVWSAVVAGRQVPGEWRQRQSAECVGRTEHHGNADARPARPHILPAPGRCQGGSSLTFFIFDTLLGKWPLLLFGIWI